MGILNFLCNINDMLAYYQLDAETYQESVAQQTNLIIFGKLPACISFTSDVEYMAKYMIDLIWFPLRHHHYREILQNMSLEFVKVAAKHTFLVDTVKIYLDMLNKAPPQTCEFIAKELKKRGETVHCRTCITANVLKTMLDVEIFTSRDAFDLFAAGSLVEYDEKIIRPILDENIKKSTFARLIEVADCKQIIEHPDFPVIPDDAIIRKNGQNLIELIEAKKVSRTSELFWMVELPNFVFCLLYHYLEDPIRVALNWKKCKTPIYIPALKNYAKTYIDAISEYIPTDIVTHIVLPFIM